DHAAQVEGGHLRGGGGHAPRSRRTPGHTQARVWSDHGTTLGLPLDSFHRFSCAAGSEKHPGVGVGRVATPTPGWDEGLLFFADRFLPVSFCRSALVGLVGEFVGGVVLLAACHVGGKTATRGDRGTGSDQRGDRGTGTGQVVVLAVLTALVAFAALITLAIFVTLDVLAAFVSFVAFIPLVALVAVVTVVAVAVVTVVAVAVVTVLVGDQVGGADGGIGDVEVDLAEDARVEFGEEGRVGTVPDDVLAVSVIELCFVVDRERVDVHAQRVDVLGDFARFEVGVVAAVPALGDGACHVGELDVDDVLVLVERADRVVLGEGFDVTLAAVQGSVRGADDLQGVFQRELGVGAVDRDVGVHTLGVDPGVG